MERLGYILFAIGVLGLAGLLIYGVYIASGFIPALIVFFFELTFGGLILLSCND